MEGFFWGEMSAMETLVFCFFGEWYGDGNAVQMVSI